MRKRRIIVAVLLAAVLQAAATAALIAFPVLERTPIVYAEFYAEAPRATGYLKRLSVLPIEHRSLGVRRTFVEDGRNKQGSTLKRTWKAFDFPFTQHELVTHFNDYSGAPIVVEAGFPFIMLRGVSHDVYPQRAIATGFVIRDRFFPYGPRLAGFAGNLALTTVLVFGTVFGLGEVRRRGRLRHNRCIKCGYSLTGLSAETVCPECGAAQKS